MKFVVNKKELKSTIQYTLQRSGYKYIVNPHNGEDSFVKVLSGTGYPRFHLYLDENEDNVVLTLHLDQKKPIYKGQKAHSGEYDSDLVKEEIERLKTLIRN